MSTWRDRREKWTMIAEGSSLFNGEDTEDALGAAIVEIDRLRKIVAALRRCVTVDKHSVVAEQYEAIEEGARIAAEVAEEENNATL